MKNRHSNRLTCLLAGLACLGVIGCSTTQRAVTVVRTDGDRHYARGEYYAASDDYAEVVDRDPSDWQYRLQLGKTLLILDKPGKAIKHLAVAYSIRPDKDEIVELYAKALLDAGDVDEMMRLLRDRAQQGGLVRDYLRLGSFAAQSGDDDAAQHALLTAAKLDQGATVEPQLALAAFYARVGDEAESLKRLRMALYVDPANEQVLAHLRAMGKIPGPSYALVPDETP